MKGAGPEVVNNVAVVLKKYEFVHIMVDGAPLQQNAIDPFCQPPQARVRWRGTTVCTTHRERLLTLHLCTGHAKGKKNTPYLQKLSDARAKAVFDYLVEQGVSAKRLAYKVSFVLTLCRPLPTAAPTLISTRRHKMTPFLLDMPRSW